VLRRQSCFNPLRIAIATRWAYLDPAFDPTTLYCASGKLFDWNIPEDAAYCAIPSRSTRCRRWARHIQLEADLWLGQATPRAR
jgi:hypothetical protein